MRQQEKDLPRYVKYDIPEYGGLSGNTRVLLESRILEYDELSIYGCWKSFRSEIRNGEGIEERNPPLIEESGPWTFPGSPTRSTTYSLVRNKYIHKQHRNKRQK